MNNIENKFIELMKKYDVRDLYVIFVLCSNNDNNDHFEGIRNLFANIISIYDYKSRGIRINFENIDVNNIYNILIEYLSIKYIKDYRELISLNQSNIITRKQMNYELSSPKTFPKIFIDSIKYKLKPFEKFLVNKYKLTLEMLEINLQQLIKDKLNDFNLEDVINHNVTNITKYLPSKLLDDLIAITNKTINLNEINSFDKRYFFPCVKKDDEYHVFSFEVFIDKFYKCIHRLVLTHSTSEEKNEYLKLKGELFNESAMEIFKLMGFNNIYCNYTYKKGEIDILIDDNDVLLVIECKARNYTNEISGISPSFNDANENNLEHASEQIQRFISLLKETKTVSLNNGKKILKIEIEKYNYIIPIVLNLENMAELNANYEERNNKTVYISFDDLLIIKNILIDKSYLFVDFLSQILKYNKIDSYADDIIDIFVYYCLHADIGKVFSNKEDVDIYQIGNLYLIDYFTYMNEEKPLQENNILKYVITNKTSFKNAIDEIKQIINEK